MKDREEETCGKGGGEVGLEFLTYRDVHNIGDCTERSFKCFTRCQFVLIGGPIGEPVVLAGLCFGYHRMEEYLVTLHFGRFVLWLV